jgi:hypothetical protein
MPRPFNEAFDLARSLSSGWRSLKAALWPMLVGAVLMQCTEGGGSGGNYGGGGGGDDWGGSESWDSHSWEHLGAQLAELGGVDPVRFAGSMGASEALIIGVIVLLVLGLALLCGAVVFVFRAWVRTGWIRLHMEVLGTGTGSWGTLFGGADAFLRMAGYELLRAVIQLGSTLLAMIPGGLLLALGLVLEQPLVWGPGIGMMALLGIPVAIYVGLGLEFGGHAVALDGAPVMAAVERSWELARGNRLWMLLYLFVTGVVHIAGMCLCCVGVFFTRAIVDTARTESYLLATRDRADTDGFWSLQGQA